MALEIKQSLKLSQQLVMTPQLQQAIKLLQLNRLELVEAVSQEVMENPLLEEIAETTDNPEGIDPLDRQASSDPNVDAPGTDSNKLMETEFRKDDPQKLLSGKEDIEWESYIEELNSAPSVPSTRMNSEELPAFENILTKTTTLTEHLLWQLGFTTFAENERMFSELVIGNLNEDGLLIASFEDLAKEAGLEVEDATEVLKILQRFDPLGVCSRNIQECLLAQAEFLIPRNTLLEKIVLNHLHDLEKKNYSQISKALGVSMDDIIFSTKIILELEPKPGRSFVTIDNTQYITPDIYVYKVGDKFVITLNEDGMPKLRVSSYYKSVLANTKTDQAVTKGYLQDKLRSAVWLIRSIHNRQKTIYKVTESIVKHQKDFFEKGVGSLRPMVLKDVANDIGMHESTVSRVTTNKFVHTPVGIFELKYFFNSSISSRDGAADLASEAVKDRIRQLVVKEDDNKPLSDQRIVELLKAENIDIARRTVAKYREFLRILPSSKRKKGF